MLSSSTLGDFIFNEINARLYNRKQGIQNHRRYTHLIRLLHCTTGNLSGILHKYVIYNISFCTFLATNWATNNTNWWERTRRWINKLANQRWVYPLSQSLAQQLNRQATNSKYVIHSFLLPHLTVIISYPHYPRAQFEWEHFFVQGDSQQASNALTTGLLLKDFASTENLTTNEAKSLAVKTCKFYMIGREWYNNYKLVTTPLQQ